MSDPCPVCGFEGRTVSPADAAVALRSYPRRYRALLTQPMEDEGDRPDDPARRPGSSGWSAVAHAHWAAMAFDAVSEALHQVLIHDHPDVSAPTVDPPDPPPVDEPTPVGLDRLTVAAESLAMAVEHAGAGQWTRTGTTGVGEVSALDLVRLAVHQGIHHLRAAERVLKEVTGRPG